MPQYQRSSSARKKRDLRIDACRGFALIMILIDHISGNTLAQYTMWNFGFCDAADLFVFLSGYSVWLAYGRKIEQPGPLGGWMQGLRKITRRWLTIYIYQFLTVLICVMIVREWLFLFNGPEDFIEPVLTDSWTWLSSFAMLQSLPQNFNILPLYSVLLALTPAIIALYRVKPSLLLIVSIALWLCANMFSKFNFHNDLDPNGWYFNPFGWQFIFVIGMLLAVVIGREGGFLRRNRSLKFAAIAFLIFAFFQNFPWEDWYLPSLRPFASLPFNEKTPLSPWRCLDVISIMYLVLSIKTVSTWTASFIGRFLALFGRHSLDVFCFGTIATIVSGLFLESFGSTILNQFSANALVFLVALLVALFKDGRKFTFPRLTILRQN